MEARRVKSVEGSGVGAKVWAGRVMSGLAIAFLAFDATGKLLLVQPVLEGTAKLGYPVSAIFGIGLAELVCVLAYLAPRTSLLGAILTTGYLGGAVATHVRIGDPLFTHVLFPTYLAAFVWGGLVLRDARLRAALT